MKLIIASTFLFASATAFSGAYLDQLVSTNNAPTGGGVGGYLDYLPASPAAPTAGAGLFNHLDSLGGRSTPAPFVPAPAAPAPVAPAPVARAPVPVASSAPAVVSAATSGPGLTTHLDTLRTSGSVSGPGLLTHVDTLTTNAAPTGTGASLIGYLSALPNNVERQAGAGITTHVDALASNTAIAGSGVVAATGPSGGFLDKVFQMLIQLSPSDVAATGGQLNKSGNDVVFAAGSGNMAMTFIKK